MLKKGDPLQTDVKIIIKLLEELLRLAILRSKTAMIPDFYDFSYEFERYLIAKGLREF
jgi:hypothetical protein